MRVAVLASGTGSNLQSIIDHFSGSSGTSASIVLVGSNRAESGAIARARAAGIATHVVDDATDGATLLTALGGVEAELLVLAGYLKLVPMDVVQAFRGRLLNVHPALLPAFGGHGMYGAKLHEAVLASGAKWSGVTVHFVNEDFDRGPIAAQWPVPVLEHDTAQSLAARVLQMEHQLYPLVIEAVATGRIQLDTNGHVHGDLPASALFVTHMQNFLLQ